MSGRTAFWRFAAGAVLVAAALAAAAVQPPPAEAGRAGFSTGIMGSSADALEGAQAAHADSVRIGVFWRDVVGAVPPSDAGDPSDPAYSFAGLDAAVRDASARGLEVLFTVNGAPDWAEGADRPKRFEPGSPGTWKPDPGAFGDFALALARRYSGEFPDPLGPGPLPRVRFYGAWSEPNLGLYLAPQYERGRPTGARVYRRLLNSFAAAVKSVDRDNRVVGPSLAPFGGPISLFEGRTRTRPLRFLRDLLCLEGRRRLRAGSCPARKRARIDVLSHHPIAVNGGPGYSAPHPDDASSGDLDRVRRVLRAAERAGTIRPAGRRPLWATEYWWRSDPPNEVDGVPLRRQARRVAGSLYEFWKDGARAAFYLILNDDEQGWGLLDADGSPKPSYRAFSFPFAAERISRRRVLAWGKAPRAGTVRIERRRGKAWRVVGRRRVRAGRVFTARVPLRGEARLRAAVAGEWSVAWRQR